MLFIVILIKIQEHQTMLETIGDRIKKAIDASEFSRTSIAEACGVSKQAITGWIKKNSINKTNLLKVSRLTKTNYEWLLSGKGTPSDKNTTNGIEEEKASYGMDKNTLKKAIKLASNMITKHKIKPTEDEKAGMIADIYEELLRGKE